MRKFESLQKDESRTQSAHPSKAAIEWSGHVISIVACCRSVKLCTIAAQAFWSQQSGCVVWILLWSESSSSKWTKLQTATASNNRDHAPQSLYYCLFVPLIYMGLVVHAHPIHGESHIQHNANWEIATTSPPFLQWTALITRSFSEGCTWSDLHILVTEPLCCNRKDWVASAQSFTLWQQTTIRDHMSWSLDACLRHKYTGVVLHAYPGHGESHIQHNANGEVAT